MPVFINKNFAISHSIIYWTNQVGLNRRASFEAWKRAFVWSRSTRWLFQDVPYSDKLDLITHQGRPWCRIFWKCIWCQSSFWSCLRFQKVPFKRFKVPVDSHSSVLYPGFNFDPLQLYHFLKIRLNSCYNWHQNMPRACFWTYNVKVRRYVW